MFPILYENISNGTVPAHNGLGVLSDCLSCISEQERNGAYALTMEYPRSGIHAEELGYRRIIKAKPNFTDNPQLFRIDRIGKEMNGKFTVYAKHISYDLSGFPIISGEANNAASACVLLQRAAPGYSITTDKTVAADFRINAPASVKSFFAGKKGSFLDIYGPAEIKYDNFNVAFLAQAGANRGVTIRYEKNLLELSQEIDASKLYTAVLCFYKPQDGSPISGEQVATGLTLDTDRVLIIDCTSEYQEAPTPEELTARATRYKNENITSLTVPSNNIKLDFVQSGELANRVDLCDTVSVYYEALGITREEVKCIRTKWDCLREKYIEIEFGDAKQSLSDTVTQVQQETAEAGSAATSAINIANSKKRVFMEEPVPPYDIGDLWLNDGTIYNCVEGKQETIIKEASGPVATFVSEINADLIECEAGINYQQDLHGYSKPWAGGTGKNLVFETISDANIDGTGTITAAVGFSDIQVAKVTSGQTYAITTDAGQFIGGFFTSEPDIGSTTYDGQRIVQNAQTFTAPVDGFVVFRTSNGYTTPQLEKGSTSTSWEPYANVCPIIGYDEANISRAGKNMLKNTVEDYHSGNVYWTVNKDKSLTLTGTATSTVFIPLASTQDLPAGTYTMKTSGHAGIQVLLRKGSISGADVFWSTDTGDRTATVEAGTYAGLIRIANGTVTDGLTIYPQMEAGTEATDYEAYDEDVFNIKYGGDTVYKGTFDAASGTITVTHAAVDLGDLSWSIAGTTDSGKKRFRGTVSPEGKAVANNQKANIVCEQYGTITANDTYSKINGISGSDVDKYIFIYDETKATMTADQFTAAVEGIKLVYELAESQTFQLTPTEIETLRGINNVWTDTNGNTAVTYKETGFEENDWTPATDYVEESRMEAAIRDASEIITGTTGGNVVLHLNNAGQPYEILILDKDDQTTPTTIENAERVWRWNAGGLGFSQEGYNSLNYKTALTRDGKFNADIIQTGTLDASVVTIQHLTASMIEGGKLTLGGLNNQEGVFELKNEAGLKIGEMTSEGFIFYGAGPEGQRPYIKLNNEVGFAGYDKNDNKLFWVNLDEFRMKKCVAEEEINACGKIKFVPVTIRDQNNNIINDGVAEVAIV